MIYRQGLLILFLGVLAFSMGCAPLTERSKGPALSGDVSFCYAIFPVERWESVHKVEAAIQGKAIFTLLGVTRGDPKEDGLHSLLLTPEGFILLEAEMRDGKTRTLKAIAPFDSPAFTSGLMEDVRLLFLSPKGKPASGGKREDGTCTCLWARPDGSSTQIKGSMDLGWRIVRRDEHGDVTREILLNGPFVNGWATHMELRAFKPASYNLRLTLVQMGP